MKQSVGLNYGFYFSVFIYIGNGSDNWMRDCQVIYWIFRLWKGWINRSLWEALIRVGALLRLKNVQHTHHRPYLVTKALNLILKAGNFVNTASLFERNTTWIGKSIIEPCENGSLRYSRERSTYDPELPSGHD